MDTNLTAYRSAMGLALAGALVLLWMNAAAGLIGDGPVNLLYVAVPVVGVVGAYLARFEPRGMARALLATAVAQMAVPALAFVLWKVGGPGLLTDAASPHPPFHPGVGPVFGLNALFALVWTLSAGGFWKAAHGRSAPGPA